MSLRRGIIIPAALMSIGALALSGCSGSTGGTTSDGKTVITVSDLPDKSQPDARKAFLADVAAFEKANPDIKVEAKDVFWDESTFAAELSGGTLPTLMNVPYGEMSDLINRQQVLDINDKVKADKTLSSISPQLLKAATGTDGKIYGVPVEAYSIGVVINRDLFQKAGLNPDQPLTTWDDFYNAATTIHDKTGAIGYEQPATEGYGGWILGAMTVGFGSQLEKQSGNSYTATVDSPGTKQALELLQKLRWTANAAGDNALATSNDVESDFAAGKVGMIIIGADAYTTLTSTLGFPKDEYGTLPMPQDSDGLGTYGGGRITVFRPDATPAQVDAGLKWIDFHTFNKYSSQEAAVADAKANAADNLPVPQIGLPLIDQKTWDQYLSWIQPEINVPMANLKTYLDSTATMPLVPEPVVAGQDIYSTLDVAIQGVLGRQDANIDQLLAKAESDSKTAIEQAQ